MRKSGFFLILMVFLSLFYIPVSATSTIYYVDITSPGWHVVTNWYGGAKVVDAYGNPLPSSQLYYLSQSDWLSPGLYIYFPNPGRYYILPDKDTGTASLADRITYTVKPSNANAATADYNVIVNDNIDLSKASNNYYNSNGTLKVTAVTDIANWYTDIDYNVYAINTTVFNITVTYRDYYDPAYPRNPTAKIFLDGSLLTEYTFTYSNKGESHQFSVKLAAGYHTVKLRIKIGTVSTVEHAGDWYLFDVSVKVNYAIGSIVNYTKLMASEAQNIIITPKNMTVVVYAHNFTINSVGDQELEWFIVPVDTSEVSQLTSLNPVVLDVKTDSVRPTRLVRLNGQEFIVFQAWSNGTSNQYTVIWNYPQTAGIQGVFVDQFVNDPLLTWQESLKTNVTRVQYSNSLLYVYGDNYEYVLARALNSNYTAGLAYIDADYKQLWIGNSTFEFAPFKYSEVWTFFNSGNLYGVNITSTTDTITLNMRLVFSYNYTIGSTIALGVSSDTNTTGVIGGIIAVPHTTEYSVVFNKQLLRLSLNIEKYEIKYSTSTSIGYWTHMVQVVIYYDPAMLPPTDYFNVRLILPETEWLQQGLCRPGLADIAITDSENHLVPFWVEPYQLPDGSRAVWVKLPADTSKNMYVLNILLNNTKLTSSLSTPDAFIQYYSEGYGLGSSWSVDSEGYVNTQNVYVNTIVVVPKNSNFAFKLALTPNDYYTITPFSIVETHSLQQQTVHQFSGFFVQDQVHWIYYTKDGSLQYYQGNTLLWEVNDLNKPWTWPPMIEGATNATLIGLAILVPYSYSIGTVTGGQWGYDIQADTVQVGTSDSRVSWTSMGEIILALLPLIIIAIVIRLIEHPPGVSRTVSGGGIV